MSDPKVAHVRILVKIAKHADRRDRARAAADAEHAAIVDLYLEGRAAVPPIPHLRMAEAARVTEAAAFQALKKRGGA